MRTEWRIFGVVAVFMSAIGIVYAGWTRSDAGLGHIEWIGTLALLLAGGLCFMCAGYFWFVSRRIDLRPEDRSDAEIAEGAGEVGFFSPGSYWPFGIGLSVAVAGLGLAFWKWWLIAVGLLVVIAASCGLLFEYYSGTRRTAEH